MGKIEHVLDYGEKDLDYEDELVWQVRDHIIEKAQSSKYIDHWFLEGHILVVEKMAAWLCKLYPQADKDIVGLAVWFHDVSRFEGKDEGHDLLGAKIAEKELSKMGFSKNKINQVKMACLSHRSKELKPATLEARILASADAMSHFVGGLYLRLVHKYAKEMGFEKAIEHLKRKLDRDYREKITFEEAQILIRERYKAIALLFDSVGEL
jgi:HD superfamily phosphodiesterase